jgi:hypothetical protein
VLEATHRNDSGGCGLSIEGLAVFKASDNAVELSIEAVSLCLNISRSIVSKVVDAVEGA